MRRDRLASAASEDTEERLGSTSYELFDERTAAIRRRLRDLEWDGTGDASPGP